MFWKKKQTQITTAEVKPGAAPGTPATVPPVKVVPAATEKLHGPQDLPMPVGRDIVTQLHKNPDWVWHLKCVTHPTNDKKVFDIRVFNEADASAKKVKVINYNTLNEHSDLILFEGSFDRGKNETKLVDKKAAAK